ncbi:MAG TPA: cytochrome P450, partial [Myxococcaceae bacterium]|nr:cytochrome P450 [Myxococcaceae bacterium]
VVTGSPEGVREVFSADPNVFEPLGRVPIEPVTGPRSVLLLSGLTHKRERKLLMPPFHGERMRAYGTLIREVAERRVSAIPPGGSFSAQRLAQDITLDIILRAVFGITEPERVREFTEAIIAFGESYTPLLMFALPLRRNFGGFGPWARFQRNAARFERLIEEQIARQRERGVGQEDILSLLLSARDEDGKPMTDGELKDELRTMILAGHETTAVALTWAMYWLHRLPEVRKRLQEELATLGPTPDPDALAKLPYLSAVCDEALRLNPVVPLVSRRTLAPFTLRGHTLPVGTGIMVAIGVLHGDPTLYPEPEQFRPERFLERKFTPFEYMPFGGGARRCVGAAFALYEMKIVLGSLLSGHRFSLVDDRPVRPVRRHLTIGPDSGVEMRHHGPAQPGASA